MIPDQPQSQHPSGSGYDITQVPVDEATADPGGSLSPGTRIDHFEVERLIGCGGMGEVYLARDTKLGRRVAVKIIHPERFGSKDIAARFYHEAQTTARFNHPHIITIFAVGEYRSKPYLALEYLAGSSLQQRIDERLPTVQESMRICLAIAEALDEAHRHGVLHRDLKPDNVVLPRDGRIRVVDFGISKSVGAPEQADLRDSFVATWSNSNTPETKGLVGTPLYMSPEQWRGEPAVPAVDIWALGVILFRLLSGKMPFQETSLVALAAVVSAASRPCELPRNRGIPVELAQLVARCLAKEARDRPSAPVIVSILQGILRGTLARSPIGENPFRGLLPFSDEHARFFYGRDSEISMLLERIREEVILPVVGPSGAGKSSFVQAGLLTRLAEQGPWLFLRIRPGPNPFRTLAIRVRATVAALLDGKVTNHAAYASSGIDLLRGASVDELVERLSNSPTYLSLVLKLVSDQSKKRVLLFVDQLEELATLGESEEIRRAFMEALCLAVDDKDEPVRVVFTIRDDFLGKIAKSAIVRETLRTVTVLQSPEQQALIDILTKPVLNAGYDYEDPRMVEEMVAAVRGENAALPMLQFAAGSLWDGRDQDRKLLLRSCYEAMGGVAGALAKHADGLIGKMARDEHPLAREVLLRLVTPERTRRVIGEGRLLDGLGSGAERVLHDLVSARLVSAKRADAELGDEMTLELAHESLIDRWIRLRRWIDESHESMSVIAEVEQAALLWERRGCRPQEVWVGEPLRDALKAIERVSTQVPGIVRRFLKAGSESDGRRRRRLRWYFVVALVVSCSVAIGAVVGLAFVVGKERDAAHAREQAEARGADAEREGAQAALLRQDLLQARAKLRLALEKTDSFAARALWRDLDQPLVWRKEVGSIVSAVGLSPDGKTVAVGGIDSVLHLFDTETGSSRSLRGHDDQIYALVFSPSGDLLASGSRDGQVFVWAPKDGKIISVIRVQGEASDLAFTPDGEQLVIADRSYALTVWKRADRSKRIVKTGEPASAIAIHPSSRSLAAAEGSTIEIVDLSSDRPIHSLRSDEEEILDVAYGADGGWLVAGSADGTLRSWNVQARRPIATLRGHKGPVRSVAVSSDGQRIISGGSDGDIRVWPVGSASPSSVLRGHDGEVVGVSIGGGDHVVASAGRDRTVRLWSLGRAPIETSLEGIDSPLYIVVFSPDGTEIAAASESSGIRIWDRSSGEQVEHVDTETTGGFGVAFSPDGRTLGFSGDDGVIRLLDRSTGTRTRLTGHTAGVRGIRFSRSGKWLVSAGRDHTVRLWDVRERRLAKTLVGHVGEVFYVDIDKSEERIASTGSDGTVRLWDVASGRQLEVLSPHEGPVYAVIFDTTGRFLASAGEDGRVVISGVDGGRPAGSQPSVRKTKTLEVFGPVDGRVYNLAFHPSGESIAAPSSDRVVRIWNLASKTSLEIQGHHAEVNGVDFSPDGRTLATTSDDGVLRTFSAETGAPEWRLRAVVASESRIYSHEGWKVLDAKENRGRPKTAWAAVVEDALDGSERDGMLCVLTPAGQVELWNVPADQRVFQEAIRGGSVQSMTVVPGVGCLVRSSDRVVLFRSSGPIVEYGAKEVITAASASATEIVVADGADVVRLDPKTGAEASRFRGGVGMRALLRMAEGAVLIGYVDGSIEFAGPGGNDVVEGASFADLPASSVTTLAVGSTDIVLAGFANGTMGVWHTKTGARLASARLHGEIKEIYLRDHRLIGISDLGRWTTLDLGALFVDYCGLMRELWARVPTAWEHGSLKMRSPPREHPCARTLAPL